MNNAPLRLTPITSDGVNLIKRWSSNGVCEIGAGDGGFLRALKQVGVGVIGYDIAFKSELVICGDHLDAAKHSDMSLLIIWPPDGDIVQDWIRAWRGNTIILGTHRSRILFGTCLDHFQTQEAMIIPGGRKGPTRLSVNIRIQSCSH